MVGLPGLSEDTTIIPEYDTGVSPLELQTNLQEDYALFYNHRKGQ